MAMWDAPNEALAWQERSGAKIHIPMTFLILGIIILILGIYFFRRAKKNHDHEGEEGSLGLMMAGIILIVFYGIFYRLLAVVQF